MVLTGGRGRSFSVGGDFNDVSVLEHEHEVRPWLGEIIDLYIAILSVNIPVVAAVDRFAIGQGLQVALMADWRIGTTECQLSMPELKNGVACPLGSVILEALLGRAKMLELLLDCEFIDAEAGRALSLLNEITRPDELQTAALRVAKEAGAVSEDAIRHDEANSQRPLHRRFGRRSRAGLEGPCRLVRAAHGKVAFRQDPQACLTRLAR